MGFASAQRQIHLSTRHNRWSRISSTQLSQNNFSQVFFLFVVKVFSFFKTRFPFCYSFLVPLQSSTKLDKKQSLFRRLVSQARGEDRHKKMATRNGFVEERAKRGSLLLALNLLAKERLLVVYYKTDKN